METFLALYRPWSHGDFLDCGFLKHSGSHFHHVVYDQKYVPFSIYACSVQLFHSRFPNKMNIYLPEAFEKLVTAQNYSKRVCDWMQPEDFDHYGRPFCISHYCVLLIYIEYSSNLVCQCWSSTVEWVRIRGAAHTNMGELPAVYDKIILFIFQKTREKLKFKAIDRLSNMIYLLEGEKLNKKIYEKNIWFTCKISDFVKRRWELRVLSLIICIRLRVWRVCAHTC